MPSKNKRIASSQAKIRNRRRRGRAAPQDFQAGPTQRSQEDEESAASAATAPRSASTTALSESAAKPVRRARRVSDAEPAAYPYMKTELIRIGATSSVIFAAIAALTFVLR